MSLSWLVHYYRTGGILNHLLKNLQLDPDGEAYGICMLSPLGIDNEIRILPVDIYEKKCVECDGVIYNFLFDLDEFVYSIVELDREYDDALEDKEIVAKLFERNKC